MPEEKFSFVDLFAGLGGFHYGLAAIGGECVFACEKDETLRKLYTINHSMETSAVLGDIAECKESVPPHDLLVAGFPCQPFSKSGKQMGFDDAERGACIFHVIEILEQRKPHFFIFENVGNLSRHNNGLTWKTIRQKLSSLGYCVRSTADPLTRRESERHLSPHHYGYPQRRERFFAVGSLSYLPKDPFPVPTGIQPSLREIMLNEADQGQSLTPEEINQTKLSEQAFKAIELWNEFIHNLPEKQKSFAGSFPLWLEEYDADYPYATQTPYEYWRSNGLSENELKTKIISLPPYAREKKSNFPLWKIKFIDHNREWLQKHYEFIDPNNVAEIRKLDYTYRKLEWNWRDSNSPNIWDHTIQIRPSGIRISNPNYVPTIVSLNNSQTPIYGQYKRHLTVREIARAFGFPDNIRLPSSNSAATRALGNAVHADVVRLVATRLMEYTRPLSQPVKPAEQDAA